MRKAGALAAALVIFAAPAFARQSTSEITVSIGKRPDFPRPENRIPFPEIRDWKTLKITLARGVCFGTCPDYSVEIDGDGNVSYDGREFVAVPGNHRGKVSAQAVRDLYAKFKKADFYWLFDAYRAQITDASAYQIGISFDGRTKQVEDYLGDMVNMPKVVRDLEEQIDRVAETKKWVDGTGKTFDSLKAEGWNFRSNDAANRQLLVAASWQNKPGLVEHYLAAGMPIDGRSGCNAVAGAAHNRNAGMVRKLIDAGAPVFWKRTKNSESCSALVSAAEEGDVASVGLILKRHPDVNWRQDNDFPRPLEAALSDDEKEYGRNYSAVIKLLLAAGADPYLVDLNGKNALQKAENNNYKQAASVLKQWMARHPKVRH